ncbi:hypothetical protein FOPE_07239 [Fonsecaea pedrosoi]|nr:hypothetical protein FOPE_07239 [Fonsecaea pedrosoi]
MSQVDSSTSPSGWLNMVDPTFVRWGLLCFGMLLLLWKLLRYGMRPKDYPPGPPTLPVVGNLHVFPKTGIHIQYDKWIKEYGPVVSVQMGGRPLILLGTATAVSDLLEKRGAIYSSRWPTFFSHCGGGNNIALRPNDDGWRRQRKIYHVRLNAKLSNNYLPYQSFETSKLLFDLLENPSGFRKHFERFTISIGCTIAFGRRIDSFESPLMKALMELFHRSLQASKHYQLFDFFGITRYIVHHIPERFSSVKAEIEDMWRGQYNLWDQMVATAKQQIADGKFFPSFTRDMLTQSGGSPKGELSPREIAANAGDAWMAATDTQSNSLLSFIKAMVLYPDVQERASREIDTKIGADKLPGWEDRLELPYMRGCMEETLRWAPTTLTGGPMPHMLTKDDYYMGYRLPAGAGVVNCVWTVNNNPERFPNPREFDPLRFEESGTAIEGFSVINDYSKRPHVTFGAGRRICPGSHVAERTVFIAMCRLLWAFEFHPKLDASGKPIPIDRDAFEPGLVAGPAPFDCIIKPRSQEKAQKIQDIWKKAQESLDEEGNYTEEFFLKNWTADKGPMVKQE